MAMETRDMSRSLDNVHWWEPDHWKTKKLRSTSSLSLEGADPADIRNGWLTLPDPKARFQQKQMQERELKIASLYEAQQARALTRVRHSPSDSLVHRSPSESLSSPPQPSVTHQPGKVRQMFEERRTKGIDKSYPLQPIQNTERSRKPLPNGFAKVSSTRAQNVQNGTERTERKEHRQNGTRTTNRGTEKKSMAHTSISSQSIKKHHVKTEEIVNRSGDLNHNHQPDLNAVKEALISNGLVHEVDELDGGANMLEDETFPEALAPVTPRDEPPARPPRRSPMTKTTPSATTTKPKPAAAPAAPPRRTPSGNASESKTQGTMASRGPKPVGSSTIRSTPGSSSQVKRVSAAPTSTGAGVPCSVCGRRFAEDRLAKHEAICRKAQSKKRKPFDALKHRLAGTEAEPFISKLRKSKTASNAAPAKAKPLNSSWRQKHEEFIQAIRAAKQVQQHLAAGGKLSDLPPPPPSENPDYVQCPHCSRRFNQSAAERHIPKCASFQFNKPKPGQAKPSNSKRR
ncbi:zinc finger C2HC domain-containing protein 1C isoform X1 [Cydia splendana]|uniref:zinc finger C2HC domain-containing protein 1C isoform X1 n=1 Tax=Cydia splendana TaxID=1100963 RepID=UPI00300CCF6B